MTEAHWMIYGAYGYTGSLIAREAVARGMRPMLAGRDAGKLAALAEELGCPHRAVGLSDRDALEDGLQGMRLVLHCAGPFSQTSAPMIQSCLAVGAHYLDITGEIDVLEAAAALHQEAMDAGVTLMPAVGFDVVPSDCLAATLARALPDASRLELAFAADGPISRGTALTTWEMLPHGGRVRRDGKIVRVPTAYKRQKIPFPQGRRWAMTIPWGDVATAYYTTGIPNVEVYLSLPRSVQRAASWFRWGLPLLAIPPISTLGRWWIKRRVTGPAEAQRQRGQAEFWGRVKDEQDQAAEATMVTGDPYALTILTAVTAAQRVLQGDTPPGFQTPAKAFGAEFILDFPGVAVNWRHKP